MRPTKASIADMMKTSQEMNDPSVIISLIEDNLPDKTLDFFTLDPEHIMWTLNSLDDHSDKLNFFTLSLKNIIAEMEHTYNTYPYDDRYTYESNQLAEIANDIISKMIKAMTNKDYQATEADLFSRVAIVLSLD